MTIKDILNRIEYTVIIDGVEKPGEITFGTWMESIIKQSEKASGYTPEKMFDPVARENFQQFFAVAYFAGLIPAKVVETRTAEIGEDGCYIFTVETFGTLTPDTDTTAREGTEEMNIIEKITMELTTRTDRSAWNKGVTVYALKLVEGLKESIDGGYFDAENVAAPALLEKALLNGASDWNAYSWGGCALCYDRDIARRLCCPSELKKTRDGERRPNNREEWLDIQARALFQACERVKRAARAALA